MSQNEKLSQAEIDALLSGKPAAPPSAEANLGQKQLLTADECDGVGEIGNISFGSAATALSILLSQRVEITTPQVKVLRVDEVQDDFPRPYVVVTVEYTAGLSGLNALAIEINDAKIIADLMMGGDGTNVEQELNELHLSAVSEAMNQMMGGAATAMSTMFQRPINISPPVVKFVDFSSGDKPDLDMDWVVNTSFRLRIGQLVDSRIMQWVSVPFAKEILRLAQEAFEGTATPAQPSPSAQAPSREPERSMEPPRQEQRSEESNRAVNQGYENPRAVAGGDSMAVPRSMEQGGHLPPTGYSAESEVAATAAARSPVPSWQDPDVYRNPQPGPGRNDGWDVHGEGRGRALQAQPVIQRPQFQDLDDGIGLEKVPKNLSLLFDVQLTVTVELGRTKRPIREILELGPGSVIELDKLAGEPVDILVNNKRVAIGEVVVIDENFGVRVTDILSQADRVRTLQA